MDVVKTRLLALQWQAYWKPDYLHCSCRPTGNPITCTAVAGLLETRLLALQWQAYWKHDYLHCSGRPT